MHANSLILSAIRGQRVLKWEITGNTSWWILETDSWNRWEAGLCESGVYAGLSWTFKRLIWKENDQTLGNDFSYSVFWKPASSSCIYPAVELTEPATCRAALVCSKITMYRCFPPSGRGQIQRMGALPPFLAPSYKKGQNPELKLIEEVWKDLHQHSSDPVIRYYHSKFNSRVCVCVTHQHASWRLISNCS